MVNMEMRGHCCCGSGLLSAAAAAAPCVQPGPLAAVPPAMTLQSVPGGVMDQHSAPHPTHSYWVVLSQERMSD